jgi:2-dehydro-3-deoxyglucarate aldolase/4-hydroxy-2-oxoheptanedioate aldolase
MDNKANFLKKVWAGETCFGTCITFSDPAITEALACVLDFVWIETEHNPLSLEAVQHHIMATKGTGATPIVRVAWNDPVLIKPVLDIGAAGVIVPMIKNPEEARKAVAACLYPPQGIRGYGPRRPGNYGRTGGPDYCRTANESMIVILQLEHAEAVATVDEIVKVPGISAIVLGPNDLSCSMGYPGEPRHPEVVRAMEKIINAGNAAGIPVGMGTGCDYDDLIVWMQKGVKWLSLGADFIFLTRGADQLTEKLRAHSRATAR